MPAVKTVVLGLLAAALSTVRGAGISEVITCFAHDGSPRGNNTQCPGSDACCGIDATCVSNRLCHNSDDGPGTFIRGPCAVKPWSRGQCAQVCQYGQKCQLRRQCPELMHEEKKRFPRVTMCGDGSFCCDKAGSACCADKKGTFLDKNGNIAKGPATTTLSWGPERTSSGYQTVTTATSSTRQAPTPTTTPDSNDNDNNDNAAKIGAGVGVPVGVIALGGLAALFFIRRRNRAKAGYNAQEPGTNEEQGKVIYAPLAPQAPQELDGNERRVQRAELAA